MVVSKRPDPDVEAELATRAAALHTPVQLALLGPDRPDLTSAAESVLEALGVAVPEWPVWPDSAPSRPSGPVVPHRPGWLRGLFVGGTLCEEAMLLATPALGAIRSNVPLRPELALDASLRADGHLMIDFGDDRLTQGRAHPLIDPDLRLAHLDRLGADPATSVLLLDVVLGHAAEPDPAARLAPIVVRALSHGVSVVVALVGTRDDPQGLEQQAGALAAAGAEVHLSNARAALRAVGMVSGDRS